MNYGRHALAYRFLPIAAHTLTDRAEPTQHYRPQVPTRRTATSWSRLDNVAQAEGAFHLCEEGRGFIEAVPRAATSCAELLPIAHPTARPPSCCPMKTGS